MTLDRQVRRLVALTAMLAPALHTLTDAIEWMAGGFTTTQLWLNYLAFLPVPAMMIGLYAAQRPNISRAGLAGAVLYGCAFIYFSHTTLVALSAQVPDYGALWERLGPVYTVHGGLMALGGLAFGWATLKAAVFPKWTAAVFLAGVCTNVLLTWLPFPDLLQTLGTALRNVGLASMGYALWRR